MQKTTTLRRSITAAAVAGAAAIALAAGPAFALPAATGSRIAGDDRYQTSAQISWTFFIDARAVDTVYIASGADYPDALAGAAAAGAADAPLLLVGDGLSNSVKDELRRLQPQRVVVLGGTSSISAATFGEIAALVNVPTERRAGGNRFETAVQISKTFESADTVFIASGANFADALAGAPAAAAQGAPVLLVQQDGVPTEVLAEIERLGAKNAVILGGTSSVSNDAAGTLLSAGVSVERVAGENRYLTSAAVATRYAAETEISFFASGEGFADALSVASPAGVFGAPVLLVSRETVLKEVIDATDPVTAYIIGGEKTISDGVAAQLVAPAP